MSRISVFLHLSLDGCFAGPSGEIDWFKAIRKDDEYDASMRRESSGGGALIFGRVTYEMMKSYWPTPQARKSDPHMAAAVNESPKLVFSRTLESAPDGPHWKNVTVLRDIDASEIRKRKKAARRDFTILGSGSIVKQFAGLGLIDEYTLAIVPIVLGAGRRVFEGFEKTGFELAESKSFGNGLALLRYRPA